MTFSVSKRRVTVKGPRGSLTRDFRHLSLEIEAVSKNKIRIRKWFGIRKELAAIRTVCSHIENMIKGVTHGYLYKMRSVYAHFPINVALQEKGTIVEVVFFTLLMLWWHLIVWSYLRRIVFPRFVDIHKTFGKSAEKSIDFLVGVKSAKCRFTVICRRSVPTLSDPYTLSIRLVRLSRRKSRATCRSFLPVIFKLIGPSA